MKNLEIIEPLTEAEETELARLERIVAKNEVAAVNYLEALASIRNGRLYRASHSTWAHYCEAKWGKSYRAINLAIQAETVRQEIGKRASHLSDKAAISLGEIEPEIQKQVLKEAEKSPEGATGKSIKRAAKKLAPEPADAPSDRDNSHAYDNTPAGRPAPSDEPRAEVFGGDQEPEAEAFRPVTDAASATVRIEQVYEREREWLNSTNPVRFPRQIVDRLIAGLME